MRHQRFKYLQLLRVLKSSFIHRNSLFHGLKVLKASRLGIVDKVASFSDQLYELLCWRLLAFLWGHSSAVCGLVLGPDMKML